jgi:hypothetical protein
MAKIEIYRARGGAEVKAEAISATAAADVAVRAPAVTAFTIEVRFMGGLSDRQKSAFEAAANRWTQVITGDLPAVRVDNEVIDDIVILAQGDDIDGTGNILGQAGPIALRPGNARRGALLPAKGIMVFDSADLLQMEEEGTLNDVITHEMGHVLGLGTVWTRKRLLRGAGSNNPKFIGPLAQEEYGILRGARPTAVPVENRGGPGTRDGHWRDTIFGNELMTGFVGDAGNPLSRLTVASLEDMGYEVNLNAAEPYELPNIRSLAESGLLIERAPAEGMVLPSIPVVLPEDSLE